LEYFSFLVCCYCFVDLLSVLIVRSHLRDRRAVFEPLTHVLQTSSQNADLSLFLSYSRLATPMAGLLPPNHLL